MKRAPLTALFAALLAASLAACSAAYRGAVSDHFDGRHFFNPGERFDKNALDLLRYWWEREPGEWTRNLDVPPGPKPPATIAPGALRVSVINHASVLIQADGVNLLTDPIWSERASPVSWAGPRRYVPPGIAFDDLPRIHAVLISHDHYDHLDLPTLQRLRERDDPVMVVGLGQGQLLRDHGLANTVELDWWESWQLPGGCRLWGAPARHWTGRSPLRRNDSLWLSYVIETRGGPVYFAGDTGYGPHFADTRQRFGAMRLALLPIGAYEPRWLTAYQHLDPAQAVQAHRDLASATSLGVHFGTFELSDEDQFQPPRDLAAAVAAAALEPAVFRAPEFGAGYDVPAVPDHPGCSP